MFAGRMSPRARRAAAGLTVAAGLVTTGCAQALLNPVSPGPASTAPAGPIASTSDGNSERSLAPLTGLPARSASAAARPAVALAVAGTNPRGLASADVVFEEAASRVRYIAVYQSDVAPAVGPITSTDPTDRGVLTVLHPLLGYDGAAAPFLVTQLDKTKIVDVGFARHSSLYASGAGGLTTTPAAILHVAGRDTAPPPLFNYRGAGAVGGALASTGVLARTAVSVHLPGLGTQDWSFDRRTGRWTMTRGGPNVQVANLVIQMVSYRSVHVNARRGITAPDAVVSGTGRAEVFSGGVGSSGREASGTWSKPRRGLVTNYFDSSGSLMSFEPGPTWVILAPPGTRADTTQR